MPTGFQVLLQDEYSDVIDSAFVDPRILGTLRRAQRRSRARLVQRP
jgi:hypothetical protein